MDSIIERIKKLLALAANNSNEHEAALAASKAQTLLEEHNLSMAAISRDPTKRDDKRRAGGLYGWQRMLWGSVANMNFCVYFSYKGVKKGSQYEHRVVGSEANVAATEVMAEYLQGTVERLAQQWAKGEGLNVFCRDAIAYREGMANRLAERLGEIRADKVAQAERQRRDEDARRKADPSEVVSNALTILDVISTEEDLNEDHIKGLVPGTTAANKARNKALTDAWWEKHKREQEEEARKEREWAAAHPIEAARKAEKEAVQAAARLKKAREDMEKRAQAHQRKQERRALTDPEKRARLRSFGEGYRKAEDIGLDDQLSQEQRAKIGQG